MTRHNMPILAGKCQVSGCYQSSALTASTLVYTMAGCWHRDNDTDMGKYESLIFRQHTLLDTDRQTSLVTILQLSGQAYAKMYSACIQALFPNTHRAGVR